MMGGKLGPAESFRPFNQYNNARCLLSLDESGALIQDQCFGWHAGILILVGIFAAGPYSLITSAISAVLGTHPKLKGSKVAKNF